MKKKILFGSIAMAAMSLMLLSACNKSDSATPTTTTTSTSDTSIPAVYKKIYGASSMYIDGDYIVITTKDLPDHKSTYYKGTQWESSMYEAYNGSNSAYFSNNAPIEQQNVTFRLPLHPEESATHPSTPLGPIGIALNGVLFFNQYAGNGNKLGSAELNTFDQYNGHTTPMGDAYHYHVEPLWLTQNKGKDALLGFLLDGYPVYGPVENGKTLTNADLDAYHGHFGPTADYPNGIYHYHITAEDPYINGDGFYGNPGTVSF